MRHFVYRLLPPRPTFPKDITTEERAIMSRHVTYWRSCFSDNSLIVMGPVADPNGTYGIAILRLRDETDAGRLARNDPAILADAGFRYELCEMQGLTKDMEP